MELDLSNPIDRLRLSESVSPEEYCQRMQDWQEQQVIEIVNGHPIRKTMSKFGVLYTVGDPAIYGYARIEGARIHANREARGPHADTPAASA